MTTRTYTQKDGTIWEWEENAEVLEALKVLHEQHQIPTTGQQDTLV
jgi:hypothetical protein